MASDRILSQDLGRRVVAAARRALPGTGPMPLHEPVFRGREWEYVKKCLDDGWVSTAGEFVTTLEQTLADLVGVRHAIAMVNGTAALHLALHVLGVKPGDEVLVPALTFVATPNAVAHAHAVPHFVDASEKDFGIDAVKLDIYLEGMAEKTVAGLVNRATGRRIAALVVTHAMGHPADIKRLAELAARWGLPLLEDAAEALGSRTGNRHVGSFGAFGALSFNGNKIATTGGGGALLTDDAELARHARALATTAKRPHQWRFDHDEVAWNYRMPNINAALGMAQIEQLNTFLADKRKIMARYEQAFANFSGGRLFQEQPGVSWNHWLVTLLLDSDESEDGRDQVLTALHEANILARPVWTPLHQLPMYASNPRGDMSATERLSRRIINLPSGAGLA